MLAATIDRYLAALEQRDPTRGKAVTKPGELLRNSITLRKAGNEVEAEPGFFEVDTLAHCGPNQPEGRVLPKRELHRCPYRLGVHPFDP